MLQHPLYWCLDERLPLWSGPPPTLEFLATLGDRPAQRIERLPEAADLSRWLTEAGLAESPAVSGAALNDARELREATYRVLNCARAGNRPPASELALLNEWARRPTSAPQVGRDFKRTSVGPDAVTGALAGLARTSVELITRPELKRVRNCAGWLHCFSSTAHARGVDAGARWSVAATATRQRGTVRSSAASCSS